MFNTAKLILYQTSIISSHQNIYNVKNNESLLLLCDLPFSYINVFHVNCSYIDSRDLSAAFTSLCVTGTIFNNKLPSKKFVITKKGFRCSLAYFTQGTCPSLPFAILKDESCTFRHQISISQELRWEQRRKYRAYH